MNGALRRKRARREALNSTGKVRTLKTTAPAKRRMPMSIKMLGPFLLKIKPTKNRGKARDEPKEAIG